MCSLPPKICLQTSLLNWCSPTQTPSERMHCRLSHPWQVRAVWRAWLHYASFTPSQVRALLIASWREHACACVRAFTCKAHPSHQPCCSFQNLLATTWSAGASSDAVVEVGAICSPSVTFFSFACSSVSLRFMLQVILSALNESQREESLSRMLILLAASCRGHPPPAIPQLSVESATRLSSALHALSTPGGPMVLLPPSSRLRAHSKPILSAVSNV